MKTKARIMPQLVTCMAALFAISLLFSCSKKEVDDNNPQNPDTPINDDDWQTIDATGGTIEKDAITVSFPAGTFEKETNVAVTEAQSGQICGEDEVSKFYQITLPVTISKPLTVKIKCEESGSDIYAVVHAPSVSISERIEGYSDHTIESTYSNGEYTLELPAFKNGESKETANITVGIAHMTRIDDDGNSFDANANTRGETPNKVGNISWHFLVNGFILSKHQTQWASAAFSEKVREAITTIHKLGFKISEERDIPITLKAIEEDGFMSQSKLTNSWNSVTLSVYYLTKYGTDKYTDSNLKRTIIHELMHYFQTEYDPRMPFVKAVTGGDMQILYESGAVWSEKLNDDGTPSSAFMEQYLGPFMESAKEKKAGTTYSEFGYAAAALLEYFTTQRKSEGFDNKSIVELYEFWSKESLEYTMAGMPGTSFDYLQQWASKHGSRFFVGDGYDDFVLKMATKKVLPKLPSVKSLMPTSDKRGKVFTKEETLDFSGTCKPFGCFINYFSLKLGDAYTKSGSYKDMQLKIEQQEEGVQTYLVVQAKDGMVLVDGKARKGSPLVISGDKIESFRPSTDRDMSGIFFYLITTNRNNESQLPMKLNLTLEKGPEQKLDYVYFEGIFHAKYSNGSIARFYFGNVAGKDIFWETTMDNCNINYSENGTGFTVDASKKMSNMYYEDEEAKISFSVDALVDNQYTDAKNFVMEYTGKNTKSGSYFKWKMKGEVPFSSRNNYSTFSSGHWRCAQYNDTWKITELQGEEYSGNPDYPAKSFTYYPDDEDFVHISVHYNK
ncbi:MAG: hypothetical protein J5720_07550 [Bacteroidaceae bacterium]|nr:hypothetical protein [Bacteroidaceae bacterium]